MNAFKFEEGGPRKRLRGKTPGPATVTQADAEPAKEEEHAPVLEPTAVHESTDRGWDDPELMPRVHFKRVPLNPSA